MGNSNKLILVHINMEEVSIKGKIDVLLTPQFYTLKREPIPVKYAYQAKRIAPSLFEGLVESEGEYNYLLTKEKEGWLFIAYDVVKIKAFLKIKGIKSEQVGKVFFTQYMIDYITSPISLGDNSVLVVLDDTVVIAPESAFITDELENKFDNKMKLSNGVSLGSGTSSSGVSLFHTIILSVIFVMFTGMFVVEGLRYSGDSIEQQEEMESLLEDYPTLRSSYTRKNISKKYKKIDNKERLKRDKIKQLSKMVFRGSELTSLILNSSKVIAIFKTNNRLTAGKVSSLARKDKLKVTKTSNILTIEGAL